MEINIKECLKIKAKTLKTFTKTLFKQFAISKEK